MLSFRDITIDDRADIERHLASRRLLGCEYTFPSLFIWQKYYKTAMCTQNGFLYLRTGREGGRIFYKIPVGSGDLRAAIAALCEHSGGSFSFAGVTEEQKDELSALMPGEFDFREVRDWADYIYLSEELISLSGKKLHAKRNFVNRFNAEYEGRYAVGPIGADNMEEIREFHKLWCEKNGCGSDAELKNETCAVKRALENYDVLGLTGCALRVDGRIAAFTFGSAVSEEMFVVHAEKADTDIAGSYQKINNAFVTGWLSSYKYINREDDMGKEGLRRAKLSYKPEILLTKYEAVWRG